MKKKVWGTKHVLLLLLVCSIIILTCAFIWFQNVLRNNISQTNYDIMQETARQQLLNFETRIQGQLNQLQLYARSFEHVNMSDYTAVKKTLNVTEGVGRFQTISVANSTGNLMNNNNTSAGNIMKAEYFKKAMTGEVAIGIAQPESETDELRLLYAVPIYHKKTVTGVLVGSEGQSDLNQSVMTDSFGGMGASFIVDQQGEILLHSENGKDITGEQTSYLDYLKEAREKNLFRKLQKDFPNQYANVYRYRIHGAEYITIRNKISNHDWNLILQVNASFVNSQSTQILIYVLILMLLVLVSMFLIFVALFQVQRHSKDLRHRAECDLLTNLLNKKTFERSVETIISTHSMKESGALLIIDLDNFKGVNDTYGHAVGDKVLAGVADKMRETFRQQDYLGRIGGDEFAVYLAFSETVKDEERSNIIRSRAAYFGSVVGKISEENGLDRATSCSIGIAIEPQHGMNYEELFNNADKALYLAKDAGKNQYYLAE